MKCFNCGFENKEDALFCANCGNSLKHKCPSCGHVLEPNSRFCDQCGHEIPKEKKNDSKSMSIKPKKDVVIDDGLLDGFPSDGKVHFNTVIKGKRYFLAAVVTYLGLPILLALAIVLKSSIPFGLAVYFSIALPGLYRFKKWGLYIVLSFLIIIAAVLFDYSVNFYLQGFVSGYLFTLTLGILVTLLTVYFYKRREAYSNTKTSLKIK